MILSCQVVCVRDWVNLILKWAGFGICGHYYLQWASKFSSDWLVLPCVLSVACGTIEFFSDAILPPSFNSLCTSVCREISCYCLSPSDRLLLLVTHSCTCGTGQGSLVLVQTQSWSGPAGLSGRTFLAFLLSLPCDGQTLSYICDWSWARPSFPPL